MKPVFNTLWMLGIALSLSACISAPVPLTVATTEKLRQ
ncbi:polysaccharide deacetylase family protein, partial [Pseudomonas syringae pv. actinidiae ICMP 19070]